MASSEQPEQLELRRLLKARGDAGVAAAAELETEEQDPDPNPNRIALLRPAVTHVVEPSGVPTPPGGGDDL